MLCDARLQFDTRAVALWLIENPTDSMISLEALPHLLQSYAGPGELLGRDRVRRMLRELESAGYLIRARSRDPNGQWRWIIELAASPDARAGPTGTRVGSTVSGSPVNGSPTDGSALDGQGVFALIPKSKSTGGGSSSKTLNPESGYSNRPTTTVFSNATTTTAVNSAARNRASDSDAKGGAEFTDLRFPAFLRGRLFNSARRLMASCPREYRQPVLDEIGAMHARGKVISPLGLLRSLVERAREGEFVPNHSLTLEEAPTGGRMFDGRVAVERHAPAAAPFLSEVGRDTLLRLRERLKPNGN